MEGRTEEQKKAVIQKVTDALCPASPLRSTRPIPLRASVFQQALGPTRSSRLTRCDAWPDMSQNPEVGKRVRTGAFDTNVHDEGAGAPLLPEGARREMAAKLTRCGATSVAVVQYALRNRIRPPPRAANGPRRQRQRGSFKYILSSARRNCSAWTMSSCDATTGARRDSSACILRVTPWAIPFTTAPTARGSCRGSSTGITRLTPAAPSPSAMAAMEGVEFPESPDDSTNRFDPRSCDRFSASISPRLRAVDSVNATVSLVFCVIPRRKKPRRLPCHARRHRAR